MEISNNMNESDIELYHAMALQELKQKNYVKFKNIVENLGKNFRINFNEKSGSDLQTVTYIRVLIMQYVIGKRLNRKQDALEVLEVLDYLLGKAPITMPDIEFMVEFTNDLVLGDKLLKNCKEDFSNTVIEIVVNSGDKSLPLLKKMVNEYGADLSGDNLLYLITRSDLLESEVIETFNFIVDYRKQNKCDIEEYNKTDKNGLNLLGLAILKNKFECAKSIRKEWNLSIPEVLVNGEFELRENQEKCILDCELVNSERPSRKKKLKL